MKTLKERVLAKCKELWDNPNSNLNGFNIHKNSGGWFDLRKFTSESVNSNLSTIHYRVSESVPESDPVWPLAASVLGIKGESAGLTTEQAAQNARNFFAPKPDTLKEGEGAKTENDYLSALKTLIVGSCRAMDDDRLSEAVYNHVSPFFLAIVRSVPNKEDREFLRKYLRKEYVPDVPILGYQFSETGELIHSALKRLCGMEVGG